MERSCGIAHWRSEGRVEGRRAAVGRQTGAAKKGRCVRGRGRGAGGRGGDHLWGAPLGFPLPLAHEVTHLHTCSKRREGWGYITGYAINTIVQVDW